MHGDSWRPKTPARTSPYDGTEPVKLLRPEDMHARPDHQLPMHMFLFDGLELYF